MDTNIIVNDMLRSRERWGGPIEAGKDWWEMKLISIVTKKNGNVFTYSMQKKSLKQKTQKDKAENKKNKWITWITVEDVNIFEKIKFQIFQEIKKKEKTKMEMKTNDAPKIQRFKRDDC